MTAQTAVVISFLVNWLWTAMCFGTCAYAVFWQGYSGWWFVLAFLVDECGTKLQTTNIKVTETTTAPKV